MLNSHPFRSGLLRQCPYDRFSKILVLASELDIQHPPVLASVPTPYSIFPSCLEKMDSLQIQTTLAELQAELQRQRDEITFLRSIISTQASAKPKASLPDPEKFNGQAHKFDTWLPSIRAKLQVDGQAIGNAIAQFYYVYLNLDSHVQAMVLPQLSQADETSYDYHTILDQLLRVYDNPNKVQEAEDKLYALKQGADSLHVYTAKFERVLYEARGQDWPDVNKISTFRNGLNTTLRNRLAQQLNLPSKYSDFVRIVQQLAGRSSSSIPAPQPHVSSTSHGNGHHHGEPMDLNAITTIGTPQRKQVVRRRTPANLPALEAYPYPPDKQNTGRVTITALDDDAYDDDEEKWTKEETRELNRQLMYPW